MWVRLLPVCAHACTRRWAGEETALSTCKPLTPVSHKMAPQKLESADKDTEIVWTYDISWVESDTRWASRWDMYLLVTDDQVHWFSVFNSLVTVVFLSGNSHLFGAMSDPLNITLTGMVAIILLRTLNADITTYNEVNPPWLGSNRGSSSLLCRWSLRRKDARRQAGNWCMQMCSDLQRMPTYSLHLLALAVNCSVRVYPCWSSQPSVITLPKAPACSCGSLFVC